MSELGLIQIFFFMITHDYTLFEENANEHHVTQIDETNYKKGFNSPRGEETKKTEQFRLHVTIKSLQGRKNDTG